MFELRGCGELDSSASLTLSLGAHFSSHDVSHELIMSTIIILLGRAIRNKDLPQVI